MSETFPLRRVATGGPKPEPGLYVTATPIGNLGDLTYRAAEVLSRADLIACEDTRVTRRLLDAYGITTPMTPYHEHNAAAVRPMLLDRLSANAVLALVTDAGTPAISDPGFRLIREARARGLPVHCTPGPSALSAALSLAPVAADKHVFLGFPPPKSAARRALFQAFKSVDAALILYESPRRTAACLGDLLGTLGDRDAAVLRELTKRFETVDEDSLSQLFARYAAAPPKGEIVIAVAPPSDPGAGVDAEAILRSALKAGLSAKEAAGEAAAATGRPRREFYDRAVALGKAAP